MEISLTVVARISLLLAIIVLAEWLFFIVAYRLVEDTIVALLVVGLASVTIASLNMAGPRQPRRWHRG